MTLPAGQAPWFGLDAETLRFLEIHQTRAVAIPGRGWHDLRDSVMLFSAADSEPFFNRLAAVRWPADPAAFERRLSQALELFAALDRRPYIWVNPGQSTPGDLIDRLRAHDFVDLGGGYEMLLVRDPRDDPDEPLPQGAQLHHWHGSPDVDIPARAEALALVVGDAFHVPRDRHANLVVEIGLTLATSAYHAYLLTIDGVPVATGQRYTFDGASYLSSIGTRPGWQRNGLAELITRRLAGDSLADGCNLVYLAVQADNSTAIRVYERAGFAVLGSRSADLLMR